MLKKPIMSHLNHVSSRVKMFKSYEIVIYFHMLKGKVHMTFPKGKNKYSTSVNVLFCLRPLVSFR